MICNETPRVIQEWNLSFATEFSTNNTMQLKGRLSSENAGLSFEVWEFFESVENGNLVIRELRAAINDKDMMVSTF